MAEPGTLTFAYQALGAVVPRNIRTCWSSRLLDGSAVVGQFWKHQFVTVPEYGNARFYIGDEPDAETRDGFKEWKENLTWAWDNNRKNILIIEAVKISPNVNKFYPKPDTIMRLLAFNPETGAFIAREEKS